MTVGIMQPYFFPYIGYWQLISRVDIFIVYDNIQYTKKGWFNRNNILINDKKTLFTIPLKSDSDYLDVKDRFLAVDTHKQISKILAQIENSYKKAPYFTEVFPLLREIFLYDEKNLFNYIYNSIIFICNYLDISTKICVSSTIKIDHSLLSQNRVLALTKALNANKYINPIGGINLYNKDDFHKEGIELAFLESEVPKYKQFKEQFEPNMSIIDILMFNSKEEISVMLYKFKLI